MPVLAPFTAGLRPSNKPIVRGSPGVPKTFPRLEGVLEIRSRNGTVPFRIHTIILQLNTIQHVAVPSSSKLGSNDASRTYRMYENLHYSSVAGSSNMNEEILGMDLPFIISLGKDIISSSRFPRWDASNQHNLSALITYHSKTNSNNLEVVTVKFPIQIKKYDTLPLYRQFNEPITRTVDSTSTQVLCEYSIPNLSIGPKDDLIIYLKICTINPGPDSILKKAKKLKLKKITVELKEILECHEGGLHNQEATLISEIQDFEDLVIPSQGFATQLSLVCPMENNMLEMSTTPITSKLNLNEPSSNFEILPSKIINDIHSGTPISHDSQGFTSIGKLFSIYYELVIKIKMAGKNNNIVISQPITICPYDRITSVNLLKWIMKEYEMSSKQFSLDATQLTETNDNEELNRVMAQACKPPVLYRPNNHRDWTKLGFSESCMNKKKLVYNID
ncbi:hypothetical protein PACTADRAFT_83106 [Pachysolen tannophilus NRRL Y-2460]|uniref:Arrestin C-terminal-like domain-containing protein n=1 Tax=Pachysolen tannophilus NRRL Y-2460 TaxID=669874 RepID=A0A1E4U0W1_PACTA|nr:hypothetical protein PACTADRAFT_83106 [Pachysolen tannophilus NRRL Y-2460]